MDVYQVYVRDELYDGTFEIGTFTTLELAKDGLVGALAHHRLDETKRKKVQVAEFVVDGEPIFLMGLSDVYEVTAMIRKIPLDTRYRQSIAGLP